MYIKMFFFSTVFGIVCILMHRMRTHFLRHYLQLYNAKALLTWPFFNSLHASRIYR